MDMQQLNNAFSKAVFTAAYDYLLNLMNINPVVRRIYIHCTIDVEKGQYINYSIGPQAAHNLQILDNGISFHARFNGKSTLIELEWEDINRIYTPEIMTPFSPSLHDPFGLTVPVHQVLADGSMVDMGLGGLQAEEVKETASAEVEKSALEKRGKLRLLN